MTNPNIPPEIADERLSDDDLCDIAENGCFSAPAMAKEIIAFRSAPAPVRISPEVRETIRATLAAAHEHHLRWAKATPVHYDSYATNWFAVGKLDAAIAFVEALP